MMSEAAIHPLKWGYPRSLMHIIYNPCSSVYVGRLYQQVIAYDAAEESMKAAVESVKAPYYATSGEARVATFRI